MNGTIHLVRHGLVENPMGVIYGRLPGYNLSEVGLRQAKAAAEHLTSASLRAVWSSPLERAQETAHEIAGRHGLPTVLDDRALESATTLEGVGRTIASLLRSPRSWWQFRNPMKPTWGESFSQVRARMLEVVEDALAAVDGGEVVLVSHQTPIQVARLALAQRSVPPWLGSHPCATGSVSSLVLEEGRVVSARYFVPRVEG